jgi:hypothetical protein
MTFPLLLPHTQDQSFLNFKGAIVRGTLSLRCILYHNAHPAATVRLAFWQWILLCFMVCFSIRSLLSSQPILCFPVFLTFLVF